MLFVFNVEAVRAGPWKEPGKTSNAAFVKHALQPVPTVAPIGNLELFRRQNVPGTSVCGYISGDSC